MNSVTPLVPSRPRMVGASVVVDAPADAVFALLANPHRHHEVDGSSTVGTQVIGPRELQLGDKFRVSMKLKGIPYSMTSTVSDLIPGRVVEWQLPAGHRWRWEIAPEGEGTRVTEIFDWSGSKIPVVLEKLKAPERNAKSIEASLSRLALLRLT
ncbi:MAG: SRPBCC family protein [Dermatophilus congolensis]|nr:SRPBCC family protein [Dermatophilus congolensis]